MTHQNPKHRSKCPDHVESDWDAFKDMREHRRVVRAERRNTWETLLAQGTLPDGWTKHTDAHYSYTLNGRKLDYWPGPKKWQYEGKISTGEVLEFIARRQK